MPSKSKSQQRLMGAAYAAKKNKTPIKELSPELQKIVKSMNKKQLKEFAKTKTNNLPEHSKSAFAEFAKQAMCGSKNCSSSKMNNENDDCCVKDKKVEKAGAKVKIVESLGGAKPVKTSKKATALNLKQYALKKKAAKDPLSDIDDAIGDEVWDNRIDKAQNWVNRKIKTPINNGISAIGSGLVDLANAGQNIDVSRSVSNAIDSLGKSHTEKRFWSQYNKAEKTRRKIISQYSKQLDRINKLPNDRRNNLIKKGVLVRNGDGSYSIPAYEARIRDIENYSDYLPNRPKGVRTYTDKFMEGVEKNNPNKKPFSAAAGTAGYGIGGLGNGTYTETSLGGYKQPTEAEMNKLIEEDEEQEKEEQKIIDQAANETAQSAEEWNNRPLSEKLYERLRNIYSEHGRGINAAGAGLGTYGLIRLLGGGNTLGSILGLGTGGLTYALQDKNTREQLMNWLKSITDGFKKTSSVKKTNQEHWLLKLAKKHNGRTKGAFGKNPGRRASKVVSKAVSKSSLGKKLALLLGTALPTATVATVGKNIYDNKKEEERIQQENEAKREEQKIIDQAANETAQSAEEWNNRPLSEKLYDMYKDNDQMINSTGAGLGTYGLTRLLGGSNLLGGVLGAGAGGLTYAAHDPKIRKAIKDLLNVKTMVSGQTLPVNPIKTLMTRTSGSLKDALVDLGGYMAGNEQLKNMPKVLATAFTPTFSINGKNV